MSVLAVFNPAPASGKTTTALGLLAGVAHAGRRPTALDLDPQAHLSQAFGVTSIDANESIVGFFAEDRPLAELARFTRSGVVLVPAHPEQARLGATIGKSLSAITRLRRALAGSDAMLQPVIIDCARDVDSVTINALLAAHIVVVPVPCNEAALEGARQVERTLDALGRVARSRIPRRYVIIGYDEDEAYGRIAADRVCTSFAEEDICVTRIGWAADPREPGSATACENIRGAAIPSDYIALAKELVGSGFLD